MTILTVNKKDFDGKTGEKIMKGGRFKYP